MGMRYAAVCVAGTFDGLHVGHEVLLEQAFAVGSHVLIGLTSDEFIKLYKSEIGHRRSYIGKDSTDIQHTTTHIRAYEIRKQELIGWLDAHGYLHRATIVSIDDPFEPAASDPKLEALVVSEESRVRGEELNRLRKKNGLEPLTLIVVPMRTAEDATPISSTRVRQGDIDRTGKLMMPEILRNELSQPFGQVLTGDRVLASFQRHRGGAIISVGDQTTKTLLDAGITPQLMIIDNKVNRRVFDELKPIIKSRGFVIQRVKSGPGFIASEAVEYINTWANDNAHNPRVLEVDGEEDLLVLPVARYAPLGTVLYYGQPGTGVVEVVINQQIKERVQAILSRFVT